MLLHMYHFPVTCLLLSCYTLHIVLLDGHEYEICGHARIKFSLHIHAFTFLCSVSYVLYILYRFLFSETHSFFHLFS